MKNRRAPFCLFAAFLFFSFSLISPEARDCGAGEDPEVSAVLRRLDESTAGLKTLRTDFIEEKSLAMFKKKILIRGTIFIEAPEKMAWHVLEPIRYSVVLTDGVLRQWDEETDRVVETEISKNPALRAAMGQLTLWFSGRFEALAEDYDVRLLQNRPPVLKLTPKEKNMAGKVLKDITVTFREDERYLKGIRIEELGGDITTLVFINTILNSPLQDGAFEIKKRV